MHAMQWGTSEISVPDLADHLGFCMASGRESAIPLEVGT